MRQKVANSFKRVGAQMGKNWMEAMRYYSFSV